jgi:L-lactate dehydrogenase complex protein LldF
MAEHNQLPFVKRTAMKITGRLLADPKAFRRTIAVTDAALEHLPRFLLYTRFNAWGKQREVPVSPDGTFHAWYLKNRKVAP